MVGDLIATELRTCGGLLGFIKLVAKICLANYPGARFIPGLSRSWWVPWTTHITWQMLECETLTRNSKSTPLSRTQAMNA